MEGTTRAGRPDGTVGGGPTGARRLRCSTESRLERHVREAPLMIVGEGTNGIQRNVIAARVAAVLAAPR
jgi:alkylation response protein AidB-like acyl-CoA dehydrogenase